ncbi:hypothetical protein HY490_00360 [Candidatus Woesearchaeota archaeon]|nr:hypothetical protein [Candidatus Woesearchaeota archaeon]
MKENIKSILMHAVLVLAVAGVVVVLPRLADAANSSTSASVTNAAPVASSPVLNGGSDITLTSNTTKSILTTITITDNNGCEDISSVAGKLFRTTVTDGAGAADNNRTHYTSTCVANNDCTAGGSDLTKTFNCTFVMTWYADATDAGSANASTNWTFTATPSDASVSGTNASAVQEVNTLTSMSLETTSIAYGTLALGGDTGATNQNITIANHGNENLDVSLTGYGSSSGDNKSMSCTIGKVEINKLQYNSSSFTYGTSGVGLSNVTTELDLDVAQGSDSTVRPSKPVYFGFGLPSTGVGGSCTGTVVITAVSDPNTD